MTSRREKVERAVEEFGAAASDHGYAKGRLFDSQKHAWKRARDESKIAREQERAALLAAVFPTCAGCTYEADAGMTPLCETCERTPRRKDRWEGAGDEDD